VFGIFASLAEFERELIRERTLAGLAAARRKGRRFGRPVKITEAKLDEIELALDQGESWRNVAKRFNTSTATISRRLQQRKAN